MFPDSRSWLNYSLFRVFLTSVKYLVLLLPTENASENRNIRFHNYKIPLSHFLAALTGLVLITIKLSSYCISDWLELRLYFESFEGFRGSGDASVTDGWTLITWRRAFVSIIKTSWWTHRTGSWLHIDPQHVGTACIQMETKRNLLVVKLEFHRTHFFMFVTVFNLHNVRCPGRHLHSEGGMNERHVDAKRQKNVAGGVSSYRATASFHGLVCGEQLAGAYVWSAPLLSRSKGLITLGPDYWASVLLYL